MSEDRPQRKILRLAWVLPGFILLCGLQLGWPDLMSSTVSGTVGKLPLRPLMMPQMRRHTAEGSTVESWTDARVDAKSSVSGQKQRRTAADRVSSHGREGNSGTECKGPFDIPKVALLFLVRGPIHHERTWAAWLDDAAGLIPTPAAVRSCCAGATGGQQAVGVQVPGSATVDSPRPAESVSTSDKAAPLDSIAGGSTLNNSAWASSPTPAAAADPAVIGPADGSPQPEAVMGTSNAADVAASDAGGVAAAAPASAAAGPLDDSSIAATSPAAIDMGEPADTRAAAASTSAVQAPAADGGSGVMATAAQEAAASAPRSVQAAASAAAGRWLLHGAGTPRRRLRTRWPRLWPGLRRRHMLPDQSSTMAAQRLFSVYVHPAPDYAPYPDDHLFRGRELPVRVQAGWGQHNLTRAMRLLLAAAVAEPANQRFMFLDETSIPLYPPHLTWAQLVLENRTRMTSCQGLPGHLLPHWQWLPQFETAYLKPHMWRKSSQWSMITRHHAALLVAETEVWDAITPLCDAREVADSAANTSVPYPCISDEHYFPSALAAAGRGGANESTCNGNAMHTDWGRSTNQAHPFTYWQADTSSKAINTVRGQLGKCPYENATRDASLPGNFETAASLHDFACPVMAAEGYRMPYANRVNDLVPCSLFSRKWAFSTSDLVFEALSNATHPTGIVTGGRGRKPAQ